VGNTAEKLFLAYLDASGRPDLNEREDYVLASLVINERNWQMVDNAMKEIKLKHFPNLSDADIELNSKDMQNREGIFNEIPWEVIYEIHDDIFNFINTSDIEMWIIAVLIRKHKLKRSIDVESWAYRLLFERMNKFIERQNRLLVEKRHPHEYGIMIIDSEGLKKDENLRKRLYETLRYGTLYSQLNYLIEDPLFTNSKWTNLSQLVDCIAYCIRKYYRSNTDSFHTQHWEYGLKIFP
jgi:hypothetical protein